MWTTANMTSGSVPGSRSRRGELEVEALQSAEEEGREVVVAPGVGRPVLLLGDRYVARPVEQAVERHLAFRASQWGADAGVDPETERHVLARVRPVDVELVRVLERPWVAVAG